MRNNIFKYIFTVVASVSLWATSCSSSEDFDNPKDNVNKENIVTLSVDIERQNFSTRAAAYPINSYFGDGTKVDVLIFAVYEQQADGAFKLAPEFKKSDTPVNGMEPGYGQNILSISGISWPLNITLVTDPAKTYRVAFWAQSSRTKAFDTSDLHKVKVNYTNVENNDELRDAFCTYTDITPNSRNATAVLCRPFAQINIGTTGWDYEGEAQVEPEPTTYAKSKVTISGLAQFYSVVEDKTLTQEELGIDSPDKAILNERIDFSLTWMPAFFRLTDEERNNLKFLPYSNKWNKDYPYEKEEFLMVDLDRDGEFKDYVGWIKDNSTLVDTRETEIFKYLSMCYVLVPEAKDNNGQTTSSTLNYLHLDVNNNKEDSHYEEVLALNNVPVRKNWRTNIISESLFWVGIEFKIYVVGTYCGDFDNINGDWVDDQYEVDKNGNVIWKGKPNPDFDKNENNENSSRI